MKDNAAERAVAMAMAARQDGTLTHDEITRVLKAVTEAKATGAQVVVYQRGTRLWVRHRGGHTPDVET